ncbi:hypothetical protein BN7_316 [Wickerhamomyces ciferrii]|uniref:Uncharacterized protein n=1 Tax=Wickerhamomyces ciferrii (strain ATCC 14091 / BCRC 22168 / CBS 111 / JCM 3599 / NBRC 0793 / NRRL Y-1031 F-60-10) TaxID=1206466 RepID=K0KF09_WICCF|nr:uncharacterized protein BN7_316 [Wickerhamomyces ciferrii]CCH40782.1 hypothetical protein BN7_316 [Wickerhamomyces ciferrii]
MNNTSKITKRLQLIIQNYKESQDSISISDISEFLGIIDDVFHVNWNHQHIHETLSLFTKQYSNILINKSILLEFLNDLFDIDLINMIGKTENSSNNHDWLTSPSSLSPQFQNQNIDTISLQQEHLNEFNNQFNDKISKLNDGLVNNEENHSSIPKISNKYGFSTKIYQFLINFLLSTNDFILLLNLLLILIIIVIIINQFIDLSPFLINFGKKILIYDNSFDLYWWQLPILEEKIWKFIDFIQKKEEELKLMK